MRHTSSDRDPSSKPTRSLPRPSSTRRSSALATLAAILLAVAAATPLVAQDARVMFITSVKGPGNLGAWQEAGSATGLAAGDAICRSRAIAGGWPHPERFVAWLSDAQDDAYCRVLGLTGKRSSDCGQPQPPDASGGWVRPDGRVFASSLDAMMQGIVYLPPRLDEHGDPVASSPSRPAYTGTTAAGEAAAETCQSWTSAAGDQFGRRGSGDATWYAWTTSATGFCQFDRHLYCFQSGPGSELTLQPESGAIAFYSGSWRGEGDEIGGLDGADARCRQLAAEASLPRSETFLAWLSDGSSAAPDRFTHDGRWIRVDGVPIAESLEDLSDGELFAPLNVDAHGTHWGTPPPPALPIATRAWTGTTALGLRSGTHCTSWSSTAGLGTIGSVQDASSWWTEKTNGLDPTPDACGSSNGLYCFSQVEAPLALFADGFESGDTSPWSAVTP